MRRTKPFQRQITMQIERRGDSEMRGGQRLFIFRSPRALTPGIIFHIYLAAAISHSRRLHTKYTLARRHIYIFILMRVSPSCLFIKNGFLSFLSLSAPSRLFDFLCIFIGDKASLHDEDRFPLEELHHTKLPSNMHATHSTPAANSEPRKMANPPSSVLRAFSIAAF
jgi:hypothetical protein